MWRSAIFCVAFVVACDTPVSVGQWSGDLSAFCESGPVTALAVGEEHTCAVTGGTLWCWGRNHDGQLGPAGSGQLQISRPSVASRDVNAVAAGDDFTCAAQGSTLTCFGENIYGQLGRGHTMAGDFPEAVVASRPMGKSWRQVAARGDFACAISGEDDLWCWGDNRTMALGLGLGSPRTVASPTMVPSDFKWQHVAPGADHTCGVGKDLLLQCWGSNLSGQLGTGDTLVRSSPTPIAKDIQWVASGKDSSCAIDVGHNLYCWGDNSRGQLGLADTEPRLIPTPVAWGKDWRLVSLAKTFGCGIQGDGNLWCWGGKNGSDAPTGKRAPQPILIPGAWIDTALHDDHGCALATDGRMSCWGRNVDGQLGFGDNEARLTFEPLCP